MRATFPGGANNSGGITQAQLDAAIAGVKGREINLWGRYTLAANKSWSTWANVNTGPSGGLWTTTVGITPTPAYGSNYDLLGPSLKAGETLDYMDLRARVEGGDVDDVRIYMTLLTPSSGQDFYSGVNSVDETVIYDDLFFTPSVGVPFTGNIAIPHKRRIILDVPILEDSILVQYVVATGSPVANRNMRTIQDFKIS